MSIETVKQFVSLVNQLPILKEEFDSISAQSNELLSDLAARAFTNAGSIVGVKCTRRILSTLCVQFVDEAIVHGVLDGGRSVAFHMIKPESELRLDSTPGMDDLRELLLDSLKAEESAKTAYSTSRDLYDRLEIELISWLRDTSIVVEESGSQWLVFSGEKGLIVEKDGELSDSIDEFNELIHRIVNDQPLGKLGLESDKQRLAAIAKALEKNDD